MRPNISPNRKLSEIAALLNLSLADRDRDIRGIVSDSRQVEAGDLFIALPGANMHGANLAKAAQDQGANAILTDSLGLDLAIKARVEIPILAVANPRLVAGVLADWFYGSPSLNSYVAGITGTNGKTTTTYILEQIWRAAQRRTGLIGTVATKIESDSFPATRTTPESDQLQRILATMVARQVTNIAMEVSSHALSQSRVLGTNFAAVGFTNLTQDHLDYHGDMESYYQAKRSLFTEIYSDRAFINIDGEYGRRLYDEVQMERISLSTMQKADWYFERIDSTATGYSIGVRGRGGILIEGQTRLLGRHNCENLLLAIAIASDSGVDPLVISDSLSSLTGAPGRLERVAPEAPFTILVDYAHTPDAVSRVLQTVNQLGAKRVIALLGCGGDRDSSKRSLMGAALSQGCDIAIFTSDNPRSEDPLAILKDMTAGLKLSEGSEIIVDRRAAIERAIEIAGPGDLVIVLGKGHEIGQEIAGVTTPFSDQAELAAAIKAKL